MSDITHDLPVFHAQVSEQEFLSSRLDFRPQSIDAERFQVADFEVAVAARIDPGKRFEIDVDV